MKRGNIANHSNVTLFQAPDFHTPNSMISRNLYENRALACIPESRCKALESVSDLKDYCLPQMQKMGNDAATEIITPCPAAF
ncbi:hypothetical protein [Agrobacterium sp. ST15.13.015]|uniref:hypothetical protein n=1 Tax=Agrobacterium sp. ST15.13.015 TaxID=3017319 RepID=UPI0022EC6C35|nr:hypothetical protein [Agrobacterium sp. ST15.13.015]